MTEDSRISSVAPKVAPARMPPAAALIAEGMDAMQDYYELLGVSRDASARRR